VSRLPRVLVAGAVLGQPMGGVRRHNAELLPRAARLLSDGGGALAILTGRTPPALTPSWTDAPIELVRSDVPARLPGRALAESRALRIASARFDLVHTAHLPAPRGLPVPFTITLHDLRSLSPLASPLRRLVGRRLVADALRRCACAIAVSETVRAQLERHGAPRTALVPNAADHLPLVERAATPERALLHVGHLEPRKNLELLVEALALAPDLGELWLAGAAKGAEAERLAALARRHAVAARVRFLGPVDDDELARLYSRAACLVLPSRLEGFGIPVLEAQRAGLPVAVADAGALPEIAGPDVPRFPPDDAAACAAAIRQALSTPPDGLANAARRALAESWDDAAGRLVASWKAVPER